MNDDILDSLRQAYDNHARKREAAGINDWKRVERDAFLDLIKTEGKQNLLDLGAGTGRDGLFFTNHGFEVTCVDLAPANIRLCREKGLNAIEMDFRHLDFPDDTFESVFALNSLLHINKNELPAVLEAVKRVMKPDGLFYMGTYGGSDFEGYLENDWADPKRFFSFYNDVSIRELVSRFFILVSFKAVQVIEGDRYHFQSMVLRNPARDTAG